jgi:release factor glutamine methyltransferase
MRLGKRLLNIFYRPVIAGYLSSERSFEYKSLQLRIPPGVFHPGFFHSTLFLLEIIEERNLQGLKVLELGCGSGLISLYATRAGAIVTASDINVLAVENLSNNAERNRLSLEIVTSDLFENLQQRKFQLMLINPPYYAEDARNDAEKAWYAGRHLEYFQRLFSSLAYHLELQAEVLMVLSEDCDLERIAAIALKYGWQMQEYKRKRRLGEWQIVFRIVKT